MTHSTFESIGSEFTTFNSDRRAGDVKQWTVMLCLAGNNDLGNNMAIALDGLERFSQSLSPQERSLVNILAYFDGPSPTAPQFYIDLTGSRIVAAEAGCTNWSDNGGSLLRFIEWCIGVKGGPFGARNYALILSGHARGFQRLDLLDANNNGHAPSVLELREVLEHASRLYLHGRRFDILGFDSCGMGMLEVGYELKDVTRTLVASEGSIPSSGWNYEHMLSALMKEITVPRQSIADDKPFPAHAVGVAFVRAFTEYHRRLAVGGSSVDIAAWDLDRIEPVAESVGRLGFELNRLLNDSDGRGLGALKRVLLKSHYDAQTYMSEQYTDLKDLIERLRTECGDVQDPALARIPELCAEVARAVDGCVLKCGFSGDHYQFSNGISLYFPWSAIGLASVEAVYRKLRFVDGDRQAGGPGSGWHLFLISYVRGASRRKARPRRITGSALCPPYGNINPFHAAGSAAAHQAILNAGQAPGLGHTRDAPPFYKGASEPTGFPGNFGRFKNFELGWDISGFSDETGGQ